MHSFTFGIFINFYYFWHIKPHKKKKIKFPQFVRSRIVFRKDNPGEPFLNLVEYYHFITHFWCIFFQSIYQVMFFCFLVPFQYFYFRPTSIASESGKKIRKRMNQKILPLKVIVQCNLLIYLLSFKLLPYWVISRARVACCPISNGCWLEMVSAACCIKYVIILPLSILPVSNNLWLRFLLKYGLNIPWGFKSGCK